MLAIADRGHVAELAARRKEGHPRVPKPERSEARQLRAEVERQLRAVDERVDHRYRKQPDFGELGARVRGERRRECLDLHRLDRETGRGAVAPEADQELRAGGQATVEVEAPRRTARPLPLAL